MYIYEGHMGSLYTSEEYLDYDDTYCEECGDSNSYIGYAKDKKAAWKLLKSMTDIDGSGGYSYKHVKEFIDGNFEY